MSQNPNKLLTPAEAAQELKVKPRTIANYRLSGKLPFEIVNNRKYLYRQSDIDKLKSYVDDEHHYFQ
ncbi:MAG: helix-turn-helix domain-containing protein [Leptospiraceae bacterium]|nr:helix-turn-helix domain-containing protein [Leptospiraceae bacterium]